MPIAIVCQGCQARFNVSDKFAGKKGACPKCKALITVPEAVAEEVKIHVPEEFASGGRDSKGRPSTKPISRKDARLKPTTIAIIAAGTIGALGIAFAARGLNDTTQTVVICLGLAVISAPLALAGYTFLRDDELEGYRGRELWVRAALCGLIYSLLWAVYIPLRISGLITGEPWPWLVLAPLFISVGAGTALVALDLDFTSGTMHYCFFLLVTIALRWAMGLPFIWAPGTL